MDGGWNTRADDAGIGETYRTDPEHVHVPRLAGAVSDGGGADGGIGEDTASGLLRAHVNLVMPVPSPLPIALRTYSVTLALSLSPALFSFVIALVSKRRLSSSNLSALRRILTRELRHDGFASAITLTVAGGNAMRYIWDEIQSLAASHPSMRQLMSSRLSEAQKTI